jgi:hypothetical protein
MTLRECPERYVKLPRWKYNQRNIPTFGEKVRKRGTDYAAKNG